MIDNRCDECKNNLSDGDAIYCEDCWDRNLAQIELLENEVARLKKEMVDIGMSVETKSGE